MERGARGGRKSVVMVRNLANRHSWLATAYLANGDEESSVRELEREDLLLEELLSADSKHAEAKYLWASLQRQSAWLEGKMGRKTDALNRLSRALTVLDQMTAYDPSNADWRELRKKIEKDLQATLTFKEKQ
jgi:hypothetical protein